MDVHGPLDADGMDDAEQDDDREGEEEESYEDGGSMSAQMHQFLTEMDLDLAQRKQALKSLIKVRPGDYQCTCMYARMYTCIHMCACMYTCAQMDICSRIAITTKHFTIPLHTPPLPPGV